MNSLQTARYRVGMKRFRPESARARARTAYGVTTLAVALTFAVTSCVAEPIEPSLPGYAGTPTVSGSSLSVADDAETYVKAWAVEELLVVTTLGSGSCPWVPDLTAIDDAARSVSVTISVPNAEGNCTADESPRTFEIPAGRDLAGYAVEVTTRSDD
jgi:hypothetical protein